MNFYQSITGYYEQIFPLNTLQISFVKEACKGSNKTAILDVGCGTGALSIELARVFEKVTAIDLDESMVAKALQKENTAVHFKVMNMLDIVKAFVPKDFDTVICFGNTLVHLDNKEDILNFFIQAKQVLKQNGKLLFQIINYDNIIENKTSGLPTIENDAIKFVRNYSYDQKKNRICFETILTIKENGKQIKNNIQLYPLRRSEINNLLEKAGFSNWHFYGNFKRDASTQTSIPLVVEVDCD